MRKSIITPVALGAVFVFLLIIISVNNSNFGGVSGNVVWNSIGNNNCSDASIKNLWDDVFSYKQTSSYNLEIEKENGEHEYCDRFFVYNYTNDGGLDVIYATLWNNSWNITEIYNADDNSRISTEVNYEVLHVNTTIEFMNYFETLTIDEKIAELTTLPFLQPENVTNWSIQDSSELNSELSNYFNLTIYEDITWTDVMNNLTFSNDTLISGVNYSENFYFAMKNESFVYLSHSAETFDPTFYVNVLDNISSELIFPNSNWTMLFNWTDYTNFSSDNNLTIDFSVDSNNTNGQWINASIGNDGNFSIKPSENFTGIRSFTLKIASPSGVNTSLNVFNITVNTLPEQIVDIDDFILDNESSETIDLDDYFNDSDGHSLTYSVDDDFDYMNVSIDGSDLTVELLENFTDEESFRINISDGFSVINSNRVYVSLNGSSSGETSNATAPANDASDDGTGLDSGNEEKNNDTPIEQTTTGSGNIEPITGSDDKNKVLKIVIFSLLGVVGLAIIIIIASLIVKANSKIKTNSRPAITTKKRYPHPTVNRQNNASGRGNLPPLQQRMNNNTPQGRRNYPGRSPNTRGNNNSNFRR